MDHLKQANRYISQTMFFSDLELEQEIANLITAKKCLKEHIKQLKKQGKKKKQHVDNDRILAIHMENLKKVKQESAGIWR